LCTSRLNPSDNNSLFMRQSYFVTTALEETWSVNDKIIFADEACCLYDRRRIWEKCDHTIVPYHWKDKKKLKSDYDYLTKLYEGKLVELSAKLNVIHNVNYSLKFWRVVIGPWLAYFIHLLFDRWQTVVQSKKNYGTFKTIILLFKDDQATPVDMGDFISKIKSDEWNHIVYSSILELELGGNQIIYKEINKKFNKSIKPYKSIKSIVKEKLSSLSYLLSKNNKVFIANSYLNKRDFFTLNFKLGMWPILYKQEKVPENKASYVYRDTIDLNLNIGDDFEKILAHNVKKYIPICYIEGFDAINKKIARLSWPKCPNVIYTANFLFHDTIAMFYTAKHVEIGAKLVYGQHGGVYGQALFSWAESHERAISDKYLTWGWQSCSSENIVPIGMINRKKQVVYHEDNKTNLLLVLTSASRYSYRLDASVKKIGLPYITSNFEFANELTTSIRKNDLLIRHHPADNGWGQVSRWNDKYPEVRTDSGSLHISKLLKKSKLVVYTCNSTGYLEYMAQNIPTIVYFNLDSEPLREDAKPFFEKLKQVGIYHETPQSAAKHVNAVWDNIELWWCSVEVQAAKNEFCYNFALDNHNLIEDLNNVFLEVLD
jgi:putative transferase (TIGR04331 family)